MTEQGARYDHIGSKYDDYARMATGKRAERYTLDVWEQWNRKPA